MCAISVLTCPSSPAQNTCNHDHHHHQYTNGCHNYYISAVLTSTYQWEQMYQNQDYYKEPHMTSIMKYRKKELLYLITLKN